MTVIFHLSATIAIVATLMVITRVNAVHALLYLIVSLLAVAVIFFQFGAPFVAALEVIIYAGAIMVLFVFVMMMLNLGDEAAEQERRWLSTVNYAGPAVLGLILLAELFYMLIFSGGQVSEIHLVNPKRVGISLYDSYFLGVELAAVLFLAGLIGAFHLGRRLRPEQITGPSAALEPRAEQPDLIEDRTP